MLPAITIWPSEFDAPIVPVLITRHCDKGDLPANAGGIAITRRRKPDAVRPPGEALGINDLGFGAMGAGELGLCSFLAVIAIRERRECCRDVAHRFRPPSLRCCKTFAPMPMRRGR